MRLEYEKNGVKRMHKQNTLHNPNYKNLTIKKGKKKANVTTFYEFTSNSLLYTSENPTYKVFKIKIVKLPMLRTSFSVH